jgi:BAH domain
MTLKVEACIPPDMKIRMDHAYIHDMELSVGDTISINEYSDNESIGKIQEIYWNCLNSNVTLLITWYYKPKDTLDEIKEQCSEIEVFSSDSQLEIELSTVNYKLKILTLEEVLDMDDVDDDVYFCRAKWSVDQKVLSPPMNLWRTDCLCNRIINPDIPFKVCTSCGKFLHVKCLEDYNITICQMCGTEL